MSRETTTVTWLEACRARVEKATPEPWSHHEDGCHCNIVSSEHFPIANVTKGDWGDNYPTLKLTGDSLDRKAEAVMEQITYGTVPEDVFLANRDFIARARTDLPRALAVIEALAGALRNLLMSDAVRHTGPHPRYLEQAEDALALLDAPDAEVPRG